MELYKRIIDLIDANLINCLIPIILTLILIEIFFKNRFETKKTLNLIRWTIIFYTFLTLGFYLFGMALNPDEYAFINRATGPYAWAYWMMFLSALILPFTLLAKKLAAKFWYVLLIAFAMKIGMYFESLVIIVTSFHRDYLSENGNTDISDEFSFGFGMMVLQGILFAIFTLGIFEMVKRKRTIQGKL